MKELKVGLISNKELADWFGITENSFVHRKQTKLQELKRFARFEEERGKVHIYEIYDPIYKKKNELKKLEVADKFEEVWSESGYDTCTRVAKEIANSQVSISEESLRHYALEVRKELYGSPITQEGGEKGGCAIAWCKRKGKGVDTKYIPLTPQE